MIYLYNCTNIGKIKARLSYKAVHWNNKDITNNYVNNGWVKRVNTQKFFNNIK